MKKLIAVAILLTFGAASVTFAGTRVNIKDSEEAAARKGHARPLRSSQDPGCSQRPAPGRRHARRDHAFVLHAAESRGPGKSPTPATSRSTTSACTSRSRTKTGRSSTARVFTTTMPRASPTIRTSRNISEREAALRPDLPGQSDTFGFSITCTELPEFSKVELFSNDIKQ